jgi:hypothetical protein
MFTQSAVEQCHDQKQPGMFPGLLYWELVGVYGTQIFAKYPWYISGNSKSRPCTALLKFAISADSLGIYFFVM